MSKQLRIAIFKLIDLMVIFTMVFASPMSITASAMTQDLGPTLITDKSDYEIGASARVTGSGFAPGEYVLTASSPDGQADWGTVTADDTGNFDSDSHLLESAGDYEVGAYASGWDGNWDESPLASVSFNVTAPPPPTEEPTGTPTVEPTATEPPTAEPTNTPTAELTSTESPTEQPTNTPTEEPTDTATSEPTATTELTHLPPPYIQSDKADYAPGELVTLTGGNWQGDNSVRIIVNDDIGQSWRRDVTVTVAADGSIYDSFNLPSFFVANYSVTARGQQTDRVATTSFTDLSVGTYDQCSNDDGDGFDSGDTGCRWINGNLQSNNSTYFEGDATVQRLWLTGFIPGSTHTVRLKYGTTKGGKHAYDFLTTWDWSESWITVADRCETITGCTTANETVLDIPQDPNVPNSFEPSAPGDRQFVMRGGTLNSATTPTIASGSYAGDSETIITVSFTVASSGAMCPTTGQDAGTCSVALWFGAHVAAQANWGLGQGAGSISGSPYHVALDAVDNASVGQRDNQMQANTVTVIPNGTIVIVKDAVPNDAQDFSFVLTNNDTITQNFSLDDDSDSTLPNSQTFSVPPGTWTAQELNIPSDWSLTNLVCSDPTNNTTVNVGTATATINLASNETVTCTYTDTQGSSITIVKNTVGSDGTFNFTSNTLGNFSITTVNNTGSKNFGGLAAGTYDVNEIFPPGWTLDSATCSDGSPVNAIDLSAGENVTCTFTNSQQQGHVIVIKQTDPDGDSQVFNFSASYDADGFSLNDGQSNDSGALAPGSYSVSESVPSGWDLTSAICDDGSTPNAISLQANETVTCTFTNTKRGNIIVQKVTVGGDDDFTFSTSYGLDFALSNGESNNSGSLVPGTYSVSETVPTDWDLTSAACDDGSDPDTIDLSAGENVTCTFTNTKRGKIIVVKSAVGGDATFGFSSTTLGNFNLTTSGGTASTTFDDLTPGTYNVAETSVPSDWVFNGATCDDGSDPGTIDLDPGETITCTFTNTKQTASLTVTKTSSAENVCNGSTVTYTYEVTNTGTAALTVNLVDDSGTPGDTGDDIDVDGGAGVSIALGESETFTATATITGTVTNTVTAMGTSAGGQTATASADATVTGHNCTITVTKSPSATDVCDGGEVTYTYTVTNNSDEFTWTGSLEDDQIGAIEEAITLTPGEAETFTASASITGTVTNVATASGTFDDGSSTSASDTASATVTGHDCTITVTKSPSATSVCNGSEVTYTYTVANNSDEFTWTGSLSDDQLGMIDDSITLAPGASDTFTASATITGAVTNIATASGTFDDGAGTSASDTATATVTSHDCTITVTKSPSATNVCNGSEVTYTYTVTNNSDEFTWTGTLTDDQLGAINGTITLGPGEDETFTASATITEIVTNIITASGIFDDDSSTSASDTATATVTGHDCSISITKTPNVTNVCNDTDTEVIYTYVVTNDSDFFNVSGSLSDDQLGSIGNFGPLAPGASATLTKATTVNGTVTNIATATGTFDDSNSSTDTDTATATVTGHDCSISISKTPSVTDVCIGSDTEVEYNITVTNNSDEFDWTGDVVDDVLGTLASDVTIPAGDSVTYTPAHTVNATTTNTVIADGTFSDVDATASSDSTSATVTAHNCTISITKTPSVTNVCNDSDTEVTYTYVVTNDSDFFNVSGSVSDDQLGNIGTFTDLGPGGTATFTKVATVNGTLTNTATATGTFNDLDTTTASDTATATVTGRDCTITVTKSPSATNVCDGSEVIYTYTVTNNSDTFTWTGSLEDDQLGIIADSVTLTPGETETFTASPAISGIVTNTVSADGVFDDPDATSASDTASATVTSHDCTISITKIPSQTNVCNGSEVTYTITVTNNSDEFDWTGDVVDSVLGTLDTGVTIPAGGTATYMPSDTINGVVHNTVTATGSFGDPDTTSANTSADATVTGHDCTISITKTPSQTNACNGSEVTYTITVTNNNDLFDWTGDVEDDVLGTLATDVTIAAGDSVTYTPSHAVSGAVHNTVTATGSFTDPDATSASANADATVTGHDCSISITKTPSQTNVCNGSEVSYTITVTNNSDLFDWTGDVEDDILGTLATDVTIPAGQSATYTPSHTVSGVVHNTVTATGTFGDPDTTSASANADATVTGHNCTITVTKSPSATNICDGSEVTYTYTVTNNSDFFTWMGSLEDDQLGPIADPITLGPGDSETFTASASITGTVTNTATASGTFGDPDTTSASDTASATVTSHDCTITVTKTPSVDNVCTGSDTEVEYTITVTNNSTFFDWTGDVEDDVLGILATSVTIPAGQSVTYTPAHVVNVTTTNTVTAEGVFNDSDASAASDSASATVTAFNCTISVTKTPSVANVCIGSDTEVEYTITVTNNSTFFDWTGDVEDDILGVLATGVTIPAGQSATYTPTHVVNATTTNTVTADGAFNDSDGSSASNTASATVTAHDCTISITKTPSTANICNGSNTQVTYTYVVTNNSDFYSVSGTVTDDQLGPIGTFGPLAPGATATLTKVAIVNGTVTNTATATGTFNDTNSTTDSDTATATVTGHDCSITVTKSPSATNVCNGATVTYTYTVRNNSDLYTWSGSLEDDQLGTIADPITLDPGETQTFTASAPINGTVVNTATASGSFDDPNDSSASDSVSATVTGQVCRIIVVKQTLPDGDPQLFTFSGDLSGLIGDGGSITRDVLTPGTYSTTETVPAGWDLTSISCSDSNSSGSMNTATYNVSLGETVTCTFTNTKRGHIIVDKVTNPSGDPQSFSFDASGGASPAYADFNLTDAAASNDQTLPPGSYSVVESAVAGWDLTSLTCNDANGSVSLGTLTANITLDPGETVTCTFTNTKRGTIKIIKDALPNDAQDFTFTRSFGANFMLDDDSNATLQNNVTFSNLVPGAYSVAENAVAGWDLTSLSCNDANGTTNPGTRTANIALDPGENVVCTFTNTKRGTIIVEKQTNPNGAPGTFTFTGTAAGTIADNGTITVANLVPGTYTSTEADPSVILFALTSIVCNDGSSTNPSTGDLATRTATFKLDPGETVRCVFTNTKDFHAGTIGFWKNWRNHYTSAQAQSLINYLKSNNPRVYNKDLINNTADDFTIAKWDAIFNVGTKTPREQMILAQFTALKLNLAITQLDGTGGLVQKNDDLCTAGVVNVSGISGATAFFGTSTPTVGQIVNAVENRWTGNLTTNRSNWTWNLTNAQKDMIISVVTGINEGTLVMSSGCP